MNENIDVVDEQNQVVGQALLSDIYTQKLNHRAAHVLIFNDRGELFLSQNSAKHSYCPGHWNLSANATLLSKESYEHAAERALSNWLGISIPLTKIQELPYDHYKMRKFLAIFRGQSQGPFPINNQLAAAGKWFSIPDVLDLVRKNQMVHPELAHVIETLYPTSGV
ncbi:NUDIX domain-containing protein [Candidatus Woesearchaeota archaeon]|nr:MAG: NUDIX domain-containing protein [Candidatus Woesearchaeota archaeon]